VAKIGIPRTLAYFLYFPFCKEFFDSLGHEVVLSTPTSKAILDRGVKETVTDACIPIKLYHGHVADLIGKVDYIFAPRLVSFRKFGDFDTETLCPKFLGLPDMLRASIDDLSPIIDTRLHLRPGKKQLYLAGQEIGSILGDNPVQVKRAVTRARRVQKKFEKLLYEGMTPTEAMDVLYGDQPGPVNRVDDEAEFRIAVVGYPYIIYDPYVNVGLLKLLQREDARVYTQDMLSARKMAQAGRELPKQMFWYFSNRAVHGAVYFMKQDYIDGVIHVTAFACGPDAMVDRMMEFQAKKYGMPFMSIMVDEHTGEGGVKTRIEAFLDMLRYRRERDEN
jgi:predicted nucleotide-binding protein (sugar kinase/HSP70/actin superfamily)